MYSLTRNEQEATKELKTILAKKYGLIEMKLFGSKLKNSATQESDMDLFIVLKHCDWKTELEIFELCFNVGLKYDTLLSPIIYSQDEIKNKLTKITPFYQAIEKEAEAL